MNLYIYLHYWSNKLVVGSIHSDLFKRILPLIKRRLYSIYTPPPQHCRDRTTDNWGSSLTPAGPAVVKPRVQGHLDVNGFHTQC